MHTTDSDAFGAVLVKLSGVFGKELTKEIGTFYWEALKDLPLGTVTRLADQHTRHGKFFPKPFELRPKEERPVSRDARAEAAFKDGEKRAIVYLEELRRENPEKWREEVARRRLDRIIATTDPSSPIHAAGLPEWQTLIAKRF